MLTSPVEVEEEARGERIWKRMTLSRHFGRGRRIYEELSA